MPDKDGYPGVPRWVKVGGIVLLVLVLAFLGAQALGIGPRHGPGMHAGGDHGGASRVDEGAREIEVRAESLRFEPSEIRVQMGESIAIVLTSVDATHDFVADELDAHVSAAAGETQKGGFHAGRPGTYTFYCSEPGHRDAGMVGTLVVEGASHG